MTEESQWIDFRLRVTRVWESEGSQRALDDVSELISSLEELQGVREVTSHSLEIKVDKFGRVEQGSRLRVRTCNPEDYSARDLSVPLKECLYEIPGVTWVKEHSWQRLRYPPNVETQR